MKKILFLILGICLVNLVYATTTTLSVNPTSLTLGKGNSSSLMVSYSINNIGGLVGAKGVTLTGSPLFLSYSGSSINYAENTTTTGTININVNIPLSSASGTFENYITIDGVILTIPMTIQETIQPSVGVIVFPTARVVNIQQGVEKNINLQIIVPQNYPRTITIQSINLNPDLDVVIFGDLDLGQISPGQTLNIPIKVKGENAQVGTYNTQITILATDSQGQVNLPASNIQVIVSSGISPSNGTLTRPSCSLSATDFSINGTYTFTCSNTVSNIDVSPQYNEYLEGINAELSSNGIYTYTFKPIKIGTSKFISTFSYKNSPMFVPYSQDIKITPSGNSPVGGITTRIEFFQNSIKKMVSDLLPTNTIIQVLDNSTGNLLTNYKLYINGVESNNTLTLESDKTYELRVSVQSYLDSVLNFSVVQTPITLILNPLKEFYISGDVLNITSNVEGVSYLLDNQVISNPYTLNLQGNFLLEGIKQGYVTVNKTIIVKSSVSLDWTSCSLEWKDWKKGKEITCSLIPTGTYNWEVYINNTLINSGNSSIVDFKINKYGLLEIRSEGLSLAQVTIEKKGLFGISWLRWGNYWIYIIGVPILLIILYFGFRGSEYEEKEEYNEPLREE